MENSNNLPAKVGETTGQKVDKFVHNVKFLNYLIVTLLVAFVVTFSFCVNKISNVKQSRFEAEKARQEREELYNQNQVISSGGDISAGELSSNSKQLFSNGKQAVIYAFDKMISSSMYELVGTGKSYASAAGTSRVVDMSTYGCKYSDGMQLGQTCRKDGASIANQSAATQMLYYNQKKYKREGSLTTINGTLSGTFSGDFKLVADSQLHSYPFYVINSSTVLKCTNFSISKSDGKISQYNVSVQLDASLSTIYYGQAIMEEGGTTYPVFYYVYLDCVIDGAGNLKSYTITEEMDVTKNVPVLGNCTAHTKNVITTTVASVNQTPQMEKPTIK